MIKHNNRFFLFIIALFCAMPSLSVYIYLPAVKNIADKLNTTSALVNQSTSLFMIGFCFAMVFWGSLSDRIGRRKTLTIGLCSSCFKGVKLYFQKLLFPMGGGMVFL